MNKVQNSEAGYWQRRFWRWVIRRMPPAQAITLDRFRVFVFPSRQGFGFLFICLLVWLLGTNYENNVVMSLAFLMVSVFIVSIIHTFNNLSGVTVTSLSGKTAFAGEDVEFEVLLSRNSNKRYENIQLTWPGGSTATVDLIDNSEQRVKLFVPSSRRGWLNPGRLLVETYYPLGLIRVWTWLDMDVKALIYPAPLYAGTPPFSRGHRSDGDQLREDGAEDFVGLKDYQLGHSLRHVAWKHYARGQGLYLKDYCDYLAPSCWLDWDSFPGMPKEERLSRLCYWVIEMARSRNDYGLRLPGRAMAPSTGIEHKQELLRALALLR